MYKPFLKMIQVLLAVFVLICTAAISFSQVSADSSTSFALKIFAASLGNQSPVYNGVQYIRYPAYIHTGHPFFVADSMIAGSVTFDGVTYSNVPLLLDEVNDQLITTDFQGDNLVQLFKQGTTAFNIGIDSFVNATIAGTPAYYRVIYSGRSQILAKEYKTIQVRTGRTKEETERWVNASTDYFFKTGSGYERFTRLNTFLSFLGRYKNAVSQYIRDNRLRTKTDREDLYSRAAEYYDQLIH